MRQLSGMLRQISKRRHNEMVMQASYHGIKIPLYGEKDTSPSISVSESEALAMEKSMAEAKLRKAQEFAKRYGR